MVSLGACEKRLLNYTSPSKCPQLYHTDLLSVYLMAASISACLHTGHFLRLNINSGFCHSWEIYYWLHKYVKIVNRPTGVKNTPINAAQIAQGGTCYVFCHWSSLGKVHLSMIAQINFVTIPNLFLWLGPIKWANPVLFANKLALFIDKSGLFLR